MKRFLIAVVAGLIAGTCLAQINPTRPDLKNVTRAVSDIQKGNPGPNAIQKLRVNGDAQIDGTITAVSVRASSISSPSLSNFYTAGSAGVFTNLIVSNGLVHTALRSITYGQICAINRSDSFENPFYVYMAPGGNSLPGAGVMISTTNWPRFVFLTATVGEDIGGGVFLARLARYDTIAEQMYEVVDRGVLGASFVFTNGGKVVTSGITSNAPAAGITNFVIVNGLIAEIQR